MKTVLVWVELGSYCHSGPLGCREQPTVVADVCPLAGPRAARVTAETISGLSPKGSS